jgi:hypothetical protein
MEEIEKNLFDITEKHKILQKHSNFQIRNFMIGKEVTETSKVWQCIRELNSRKESLDALNQEVELLVDNIELQNIKIEKTLIKEIKLGERPQINDLNLKKKNIIIRKQKRQLVIMQNNLKKLHERKISILSECKEIIDIFNEIVGKNGFKEFDDESAQIEYWDAKMRGELNLHAMLGFSPSLELVRSTLSLPDTCETKVNMAKALTQNTQRIMEKKNNNGN